MYQYVRIQSYTCSHTSTHSHMSAHTSCICTHTYKPTAARACTQNHTHSHTCTHTIICTYTVSTHTHKHKSHIRHAQPQTGAHTHTAYPGFGGLWSPLPVNPRVLGYLKVTGAYVQLITKPTGLGSGPRSRRGLSPSSLCSTHASREKEGLQGSYQGWKWISQFPHALCSQSRECKDVAPVSLSSSGGKCGGGWSHREGAARGSPASWGPQKKLASESALPCDF